MGASFIAASVAFVAVAFVAAAETAKAAAFIAGIAAALVAPAASAPACITACIAGQLAVRFDFARAVHGCCCWYSGRCHRHYAAPSGRRNLRPEEGTRFHDGQDVEDDSVPRGNAWHGNGSDRRCSKHFGKDIDGWV